MINAYEVHFEGVPPKDPHDVSEFIRFECQVPDCGDIVLSHRLNIHAEEAHHAMRVTVDVSTIWRKAAPPNANGHQSSIDHNAHLFSG